MNDIINSFSEDSKEPLTTVQPASTVDEIKYIVFKPSLLVRAIQAVYIMPQ